VLDYRREKTRLDAEQKKTARPAARPSGPSRGAPPELEGGGRGTNYAVAQPARPPAGYGRTNAPPEMEDGVRGSEGGYGGGGYSGGATPPTMPQPGVDYPGNGQEFDPHDPAWNAKTIECWAHDTAVVPEKTYHYRVKYKIKNPIWAAGNVAVNPQLANEFVIESDWSSWSSPVTIPPLVNFFVFNSPMGNASTCRFEVFKWENGEPKNETFTAGFGDEVGGMKNGIDFATGWTVVDFRDDPRADKQILLINAKGKLITRSFNADRNDPLFQGLKEQIKLLKGTAETTASAPPGVAVPAGATISGGK
jgi:hypothetical protein